jgi:uncharacterized protein (TIGR03435 family)
MQATSPSPETNELPKSAYSHSEDRGKMQTARFVATLAPILLVSLIPCKAEDQARFEVASVKANTSGTGDFSQGITPEGRFSARNFTVWNLIRQAYKLRDLQISGGPGWIKTDGFDIEARPASPVSRDKMNEMLRSLLAERFQLKVHTESRNLPAYALVVSNSGSKLQPATGAGGPQNTRLGQLDVPKMGMEQLSQVLEFDLDRPVIDRTGLAGEFAIHLEWTRERDRTAAGDAPVAQSRPSIFTALQEQLGLKLESIKAPVDVLVIDGVELPSAN